MNYSYPTLFRTAGTLLFAIFLMPVTLCLAENDKSKIETGPGDNGTLLVSVTDTAGEPLSDFTAILANTRMTMVHQTIYSGNSPFKAPIGVNEKWQIVITDYVGDTVRVLKYETGPGSYRVEWDMHNDSGERMEDGVYFLNLDSPSYKFRLGTWGIWNYSELSVVMPLLYRKVTGSRLELSNLISTPDTLNVFYDYVCHSLEVGSPYYLYIFKSGFEDELARFDLVPGETTKLSISLMPQGK